VKKIVLGAISSSFRNLFDGLLMVNSTILLL